MLYVDDDGGIGCGTCTVVDGLHGDDDVVAVVVIVGR